MELPSERNPATEPRARVLSWIYDYLFLSGLVAGATAAKTALFSSAAPGNGASYSTAHWQANFHLGLPLLLLPLASYIFYRVLGKTPGQYAFGIEWHGPRGIRAKRIYDWLFLYA